MMGIIHWATGIMLAAAALLALARMVAGPTVLNRALANDVLVAVIVCALGLEAVITKDTSTLPILITVSLLGFVSTVAISRFVAKDADEQVAP
ncbi:monovalent cation/H+ antiporter complex subunit F [Luteococcus japonicus]|uniref:Na(+) H(+) antiporter subunit F n=1 Tax=Luteococcus japonicus LSP_Lj1 TaxID=1255658 RepID=A0A1R4J1S4_9ACTN|nr:monovalent cation/H+ antiporter complex subunit F [Luteococcus japonicus]SJN25685.1 Na(+) H(+) antiporter subunit F [Luteococcus japonicus LSP_Lj1]